VFGILAHEVDGATATELDARMTELAKLMSVLNPDRDAVAAAAASARQDADRLVARIQSQPYDHAMTARLLIEISGHSEEISRQGERAAEQAAMALDSLYIASSRNSAPANAAEIRAAINGLFQLLENPSAYDPNTFAAQMTKLNALLR
jgi:methyl-accepting chemotaxis protein